MELPEVLLIYLRSLIADLEELYFLEPFGRYCLLEGRFVLASLGFLNWSPLH